MPSSVRGASFEVNKHKFSSPAGWMCLWLSVGEEWYVLRESMECFVDEKKGAKKTL